jgi:hypothetical protein
MNIKENEVYSFKLNSGEELVAKVIRIHTDALEIGEPVSIAPGQQGLGMVPSLFTSDMSGNFRLNISSVAIIADTAEPVRVKYIEATTGIKVPEKSIVLG